MKKDKHNPRSREPSSAFMLYMKDANLQASHWLIFRNYLGPHIFPHTFKYLVTMHCFLLSI